MKTLVALLFGVLVANSALADAFIHFYNGTGSLISNAFTGLRVQPADGIHVQFYYAPANTTNEALFTSAFASVKVGPSSIAAGRYNGNPPGSPSVLTGVTNREVISVQIRAFETNYGSTYELAVAAPAKNGRRALVGKSAIVQIRMPDPIEIPPTTEACGGFFVDIMDGGAYLSVADLVVSERSNGVAFASFKISLQHTQTATVSVDFTTTDGTALAGSDYIATNGTVTFAPGESEKVVTVTLTPDAAVEGDEVFYFDLSNAVNGFVRRARGNCLITEVRIIGTSVDAVVSFNTVPNRHYMVQRSTDFSTWEPVAGATNVAGTGGIVTILDRGNGSLSAVIYRATVLEE